MRGVGYLILFWLYPGFPTLPPDGFDLYASHDGTVYEFVVDVGIPTQFASDGAYEFAIDAALVEAAIGEDATRTWFGVVAYRGDLESRLSNVRQKHPWGADLDHSGWVGGMDWLRFRRCYHSPEWFDAGHCTRADYNQDRAISVQDALTFSRFWRARLAP